MIDDENYTMARMHTATELDKLLPVVPDATDYRERLGGIDYFKDAGLFGVMFGSAGSGKSVLALQLCCAFPRGRRETLKQLVKQVQDSLNTALTAIKATRNLAKERGILIPDKTLAALKGMERLKTLSFLEMTETKLLQSQGPDLFNELHERLSNTRAETLKSVLHASRRRLLMKRSCVQDNTRTDSSLIENGHKQHALERLIRPRRFDEVLVDLRQTLNICKRVINEIMNAATQACLPSYHAFYITQEPLSSIKARLVKFAQFQNKDAPPITIRSEECLSNAAELFNNGEDSVTLIHMPLDPAAQRDKLSFLLGLLNHIFCYSDKAKADKEPDPKQRILLCVDNADTISESAYDDILGRKADGLPPGNFYKRVREYCGRHRLNSWFVFEEKETQSRIHEDVNVATTEQAYAADIVIRLGVTVFETGYRERSLEIVKAKNQSYRRGRHHFSIRGAGYKVATSSRKRFIAGVQIFPSLASKLYDLSRDPSGARVEEHKTKPPYKLGIKEVDDAINHGAPYLSTGTVSVLVSDLDSLSAELALHFALQDDVKTVYVSTLHQKSQLLQMADKYELLRARSKNEERFNARHFASEHISDAKLLGDIRDFVRKFEAQRVVFDNLFELKAKFPLLRDIKHFLNSMFEMFRRENVAALVVDTVEVGEGHNPLIQSFAAGIADHVFILRHTESQSQPRKIFSVLKLAGLEEPGALWELKKKNKGTATADKNTFTRLWADNLSKSFKRILSGRLDPVSVALSLYADSEGSPLHDYLRTQEEVLTRTFGHDIKFHACHPKEYVAMQHSISNAGLQALGDCHIISVDEIWLEKLIEGEKLERIDLTLFGTPTEQQDWKYRNYATVALDMALRHEPPPEDTPQFHYAFPERNNFGVLACNPFQFAQQSEWDALTANGTRFHHEIPARPLPAPPTWTEIAGCQRQFTATHVVPLERRHASLYKEWEEDSYNRRTKRLDAPAQDMPGAGAFTFCMEHRESCVCFLLELVLSLIPDPEHIFVSANRDNENWRHLDWRGQQSFWTDALCLMLELLSPWDIMRLADAWFRPSEVERPCLFSRQWVSSAGVIGKRFPGLNVLELPANKGRKPIPVSGAWYYAILKGSVAVEAGVSIIKHLTDHEDELFKVNRGIGMPVRKRLYEDHKAFEIRANMPYRNRVRELPGPNGQCWTTINKENPFFFRARIKDYDEESRRIFGLMVTAARLALSGWNKWLWERDGVLPEPLKAAIAAIVKAGCPSR